MAIKTLKYIGKSKYEGVSWQTRNDEIIFIARKTYKGINWRKFCQTEKEAAKAYDIRLIELGLPPVNILKPVNATI